jgi:hypothetical protein
LQSSQAEGAPAPWGVESTDKKKRFAQDYFFKRYVDPEALRPVLENLADLHSCLAHFGGATCLPLSHRVVVRSMFINVVSQSKPANPALDLHHSRHNAVMYS